MQRARHKTYTVRTSAAGIRQTLLVCAFIAAASVSAASAQAVDEETRGYKEGRIACEKGASTTTPNTAGHSPEFVLGWQQGCSYALGTYQNERGFETGKARCASDRSAISPEPRDPEFTLYFGYGCFAAAIVDAPCLNSLRPLDVPMLRSDCFNSAAFGKARAQFDDLERGGTAGSSACEKGSFTPAPNTAGHSREFMLGWQQGCSGRLLFYHFERGVDTGRARCASDPTLIISPEPRDPTFTRGFASGCLHARRQRPAPTPPPVQPRPPDPPPGSAVIGGVNCASDDVPNYVKRQAGCPGFGAPAGEPVVQPPSQAPTPPSATPPAGGGVVNGVTCGSDDVPNYVKRQVGCPGFGQPVAQPPTQMPTPPVAPPPASGGVVNGVNCASDDVPNYVKRQAGCPGFSAPAGEPVVQPPSQAPTPPSATPPAGGGVVNGINCGSDDVPNYVKRQAGCPGFGQPVAQPPTQTPAPGGRPSSGAEIGVMLTLRFADASSIGGPIGHIIVPAEAARQYRHNGPTPPGSMTGGVWRTAPNAVTLNTTRDSRLASGRRYIVFLMFAGESVPVAILDLPSITTDYTATLDATTDGASVLARAGL